MKTARLFTLMLMALFMAGRASANSLQILMHFNNDTNQLEFKQDSFTVDGITYRFSVDDDIIVNYYGGLVKNVIIQGGHFEVVGCNGEITRVEVKDKFTATTMNNYVPIWPNEVHFIIDNAPLYFDPNYLETPNKVLEIPVTSIGNNAFEGMSIQTLTIPATIRSVSESAFTGVAPIANIISLAEEPAAIPYGITYNSFVLIPKGATSFYKNTQGWSWFSKFCEQTNADDMFNDGDVFVSISPEGVIMLFKVLSADEKKCQLGIRPWDYSSGSSDETSISPLNAGTINIPEEVNGFCVTSIGGSAFFDCNQLVSVGLPDAIESIGSWSFRGCSKLASITIPANVKELSSFAFDDCSNIEEITVDAANPYFDSRDNCNALMRTDNNSLIRGCRNTTIPNTTEKIEGSAFSGCLGLTHIYIPASVQSVSGPAFEGCNDLESIVVDENNPRIDSRDNCNAVIWKGDYELVAGCKTTVIPATVHKIGFGAFRDITSLTSIVIPEQITSIRSDTFYGCTGLEKVFSYIQNPFEISKDVFCDRSRNPLEATLYVPAGTKSAYEATPGWNLFSNIVEMGEEVFEDGDTFTSFENGRLMKFRVLSAADKTCQIGGGFSIDEAVEEIANAVDRNSTGVVKIPETARGFTVTKIGNYAFGLCQLLTGVEIPSTVTEIDRSAFTSCTSLATLDIPSSVTTIGGYAFNGCLSLQSVFIPASVVSIGNGIFANNNLGSISVASGNPVFDSRNGCNAIMETATNTLRSACKNTVIPEETESLGVASFFECNGLMHIRIPARVAEVDSFGLFGNCNDLETIEVDEDNTCYDSRGGCNAVIESATNKLVSSCNSTIVPTTVTSIDNYAFYSLTQIKKITIPASVTSIGIGAISWCDQLEAIVACAEQPAVATENSFWGVDKEKVTLYVPIGAKARYEQAEGWKDFYHIEEGLEAGINKHELDNGVDSMYYDLQGRRVLSGSKGLLLRQMRRADGSVQVVKVLQ